MPVSFHKDELTAALERFHNDPLKLTDADLSHIAAVDSDLARKASAARAGVTDAGIVTKASSSPVHDEEPFKVIPGPRRNLHSDDLDPLIKGLAKAVKEVVQARIAAAIALLEVRIKSLEAQPQVKYCGIHHERQDLRGLVGHAQWLTLVGYQEHARNAGLDVRLAADRQDRPRIKFE